MEEKDLLIYYADKCRLLSQSERPEVLWIKEIYEWFRQSAGCREKKKRIILFMKKCTFLHL